MRDSRYKAMRLAIFERHDDGRINDEQRDELFAYLEAQKDASELTPDKIDDFLGELGEKYPDLKDDIEKLQKKIDKAADGGDDKGDSDEGGDDDGGEVSESVQELMDMIDNM